MQTILWQSFRLASARGHDYSIDSLSSSTVGSHRRNLIAVMETTPSEESSILHSDDHSDSRGSIAALLVAIKRICEKSPYTTTSPLSNQTGMRNQVEMLVDEVIQMLQPRDPGGRGEVEPTFGFVRNFLVQMFLMSAVTSASQTHRAATPSPASSRRTSPSTSPRQMGDAMKEMETTMMFHPIIEAPTGAGGSSSAHNSPGQLMIHASHHPPLHPPLQFASPNDSSTNEGFPHVSTVVHPTLASTTGIARGHHRNGRQAAPLRAVVDISSISADPPSIVTPNPPKLPQPPDALLALSPAMTITPNPSLRNGQSAVPSFHLPPQDGTTQSANPSLYNGIPLAPFMPWIGSSPTESHLDGVIGSTTPRGMSAFTPIGKVLQQVSHSNNNTLTLAEGELKNQRRRSTVSSILANRSTTQDGGSSRNNTVILAGGNHLTAHGVTTASRSRTTSIVMNVTMHAPPALAPTRPSMRGSPTASLQSEIPLTYCHAADLQSTTSMPYHQHPDVTETSRIVPETDPMKGTYPFGDFLKDFPCFSVNQYALLESLGKGCQGEVFSCFDMITGQQRAIKVLPRPSHLLDTVDTSLSKGRVLGLRQRIQNARKLQQMQREIAVMKLCRHRNILSLYEVIDDPEHEELYLVMQLARQSLLTVSSAGIASRTFPVHDIIQFGRQLCSGLRYLHDRGIVHRDIKPENVLLGMEDGTVLFGDFGISGFMQRSKMSFSGIPDAASPPVSSVMSTFTQGTLAFLAPECFDVKDEEDDDEEEQHVSTDDDASTKSSKLQKSFMSLCQIDVWALGLTFYIMRYGRLPWNLNGSLDQFLLQVREKEIPFDTPSSALGVGIQRASPNRPFLSPMEQSQNLDRLIAGMLTRNPVLRWPLSQCHDAFRELNRHEEMSRQPFGMMKAGR